MQVPSPKSLCCRSAAMEAESSARLHRSASLPPHSMPADGAPLPASISRPYRISPATAAAATAVPRTFFPPTLTPSALLQRRSKAKQELSPVDASAADADADADPNADADTNTDADASQDPSPSPPPGTPPSAYEILHVLPSASQQEIKASFWRLARQHHPDKAPAEQKETSSLLFLQIHAAYSMLRDPQSRARYDLELSFQASPASFATTDVRKPHFCTPSPRIFATHGQSYSPRTTANAFTPRSQLHTPRSSTSATPTFTPRTPYSSRTWETDQCW